MGGRSGARERGSGQLAVVVAATVGALLLLAVRADGAAADPVACGATITRDTTLSADLSCTGTALEIGSDGVDLDLNGHRVESVCAEADWGGGVWIADGSSRNRLRSNGIGSFGRGVDVSDSNGNLLTRNVVSNVDDVIAVDRSARTRIARNELWTGWGKCIRASDVTWSVIVHNRDCPIFVSGDRNLVARNLSISEFYSSLPLEVGGGDRNVVRGNLAKTVGAGNLGSPLILVRAAARRTLLDRNTAIGIQWPPQWGDPPAGADGIRVEAPGTIIRRNVARDNADLGIDAVAGVIDGGGNRAGGNLNPLQCVNVACAPVGPDIPAARAARRARTPR